MKFKFDYDKEIGNVVLFGEEHAPDYEFKAPYEKFDELGLTELMEGVFEFNLSTYKLRTELIKLGYEEINETNP